MISQNPYESLFWDMLAAAQEKNASDIHIQPAQNGIHLRFRIYGDLQEWKWIENPHRLAFLQEAKRLCQCSLATSGRAQDARFSAPVLKLDIRVSLIPSLHGEKLVLRLLDQRRSFVLEAIGLSQDAYEAIQGVLQTKTGVALITGPTGSGKTTLLYSALSTLNRNRLNIVTIEDPVEYGFPGITQISVNPRLSMNEALKAILRQDPDIILLGEVRDAESAALCFQAASTGHFVLSTLHANSAKGAEERLSTLGVDRELIRSCLRFTSAQRLLPKLCVQCRKEAPLSFLAKFPATQTKNAPLFNRNFEGCSSCHCGAMGRLPVLEFIQWTSQVGQHSSPSLKESALRFAEKGEVDIHDALHLE